MCIREAQLNTKKMSSSIVDVVHIIRKTVSTGQNNIKYNKTIHDRTKLYRRDKKLSYIW
jgi:hypothetical protein